MKNKIRECFNKAVNSYDDNSNLQEEIGLNLLNRLKNYNVTNINIIDLGCGTGKITKHFASHFKYNKFYAIDFADLLLLKAAKYLEPYNIKCFIADFDNKLLRDFDLIYSNMALQWSSNLEKTIENIYSSLNNEGIFAFTIPLDGTFAQIEPNSRNEFVTYNEIISYIKKAGFSILEADLEVFNEKGIKSLKAIKKIGANYIINQKNKAILSRSKLENFELTYKIGYFIGKKI